MKGDSKEVGTQTFYVVLLENLATVAAEGERGRQVVTKYGPVADKTGGRGERDAPGDGRVVEHRLHCHHLAVLPDTAVVVPKSMMLVVRKFVRNVEWHGDNLLGLALLEVIILSILRMLLLMTMMKSWMKLMKIRCFYQKLNFLNQSKRKGFEKSQIYWRNILLS